LVGIRLDDSVVGSLLLKHRGNVSRTARALGCSRTAVRSRIEDNADLKQLVLDCRERWIDELEESAFDRAVDGDTTLTIFLLKTQARHRGYELDEAKSAAHGIASAAFQFILNKSRNPVAPTTLK
jgi:hypothetical protein